MPVFERKYYILRTESGESVGVVRPVINSQLSSLTFCLHLPQFEDTEDEFLDLEWVLSNRPEVETHRDAFKSLPELEVVSIQEHNMSTYVLVRKKEDD